MTSTTKVRWCEAAVLVSWSMASRMRCSAVSAPIVMSVPTMSLSIEPTRPTMMSSGCSAAVSGEITPSAASSATCWAHSPRNSFVPDREPSPPITTR